MLNFSFYIHVVRRFLLFFFFLLYVDFCCLVLLLFILFFLMMKRKFIYLQKNTFLLKKTKKLFLLLFVKFVYKLLSCRKKNLFKNNIYVIQISCFPFYSIYFNIYKMFCCFFVFNFWAWKLKTSTHIHIRACLSIKKNSYVKVLFVRIIYE